MRWLFGAALILGVGSTAPRASAADDMTEATWPERAGEAHAKAEGHSGEVAKLPDTTNARRGEGERRNGSSGGNGTR